MKLTLGFAVGLFSQTAITRRYYLNPTGVLRLSGPC